MKFSLKNALPFGWKGLKGWAFNSNKDFKNASAAYFEVTGSHGKTKTTSSDRVYLVLEGRGEFIINNEVFSVKKNDVVIVPKNTPYDYKIKGKIMKLFLVHTPAYDPKNDISLKD
jgi:mannose-6-phosphate isomerase-like protein (cupin superfamily)